MQQSGGQNEQNWEEKPKLNSLSADIEGSSASSVEAVTKRLDELSVSGSSLQIGNVHQANQAPLQGQKAIWMPKSYGTVSGATAVEVEETPVDKTAVLDQGSGVEQASRAQKSSIGLSKLFKGNLLESFTVDNSTYAQAQIRATFYPKFENEKSDQEVLSIFFTFSIVEVLLHTPNVSELTYRRLLKWDFEIDELSCWHVECICI